MLAVILESKAEEDRCVCCDETTPKMLLVNFVDEGGNAHTTLKLCTECGYKLAQHLIITIPLPPKSPMWPD